MAAKKDDKKDMKPEIGFVHKEMIHSCAYAMSAGKLKYGAYNYMQGHTTTQLISAAIRHLLEYQEGEDLDSDCTKRLNHPVEHIGCALANLNMLLKQRSLGTLTDDRPIINGEFANKKPQKQDTDEELMASLDKFLPGYMEK